MRLSWDIFCTVIDNFGDIGVCWRLARQLAAERGETVRLWVDDLHAFARLETRLDVTRAEQSVAGVTIVHWTAEAPLLAPQQVVIEAFACHPPPAFLAAMAAAPCKPVWINLDYLSAEDWVEGCHGLGSPHPRLPLRHHFFFPGFTSATGGLLRERELLAERAAWQADGARQAAWLMALGLPAEALTQPRHSLFCYANPALPALLDAWQAGSPRCLLVADGKPRQQVEDWLGHGLVCGQPLVRDSLTLLALPFLSQPDYDRLLWSCTLNFVRGEDSFVRAQWAARPLVWHIYPQDEAAHLVKLAAFLDRYGAGLPAGAMAAQARFWQHWNDGPAADIGASWQALAAALPALQQQADAWCGQLARQADLASQLAGFAQRQLAASAATGR